MCDRWIPKIAVCATACAAVHMDCVTMCTGKSLADNRGEYDGMCAHVEQYSASAHHLSFGQVNNIMTLIG